LIVLLFSFSFLFCFHTDAVSPFLEVNQICILLCAPSSFIWLRCYATLICVILEYNFCNFNLDVM
jgi:hypothetical protein